MGRMTKTIGMAGIVLIIISVITPVAAELTTFDDYQFVTDTHIQAHTWDFDLTVKNPSWSVTGRVLTYRFYDMNDSSPINYISPVDILLGTGPLADGGDEYNMSFSWGDRYVNVSFSAPSYDVPTILSSLGNVHCIARTQDALNVIKSVQNNTMMKLAGYLVDVAGWNTTATLHWKTDTQFGNEDCEILVISDAIPGDVTPDDLMIAYILIIGIAVSATLVIVIQRYDKKRCSIPTKKIGKIA